MVNYLSTEDRRPDSQYQDLLREVLYHGDTVHPIQGGEAKMLVGKQLRYDMKNGFPLITERDLSGLVGGALAEHIAFLNGARTQEELEAWGCKWWKPWLTKEQCEKFGLEQGDMGDGSYGAAWTRFPTAEGEPFDQIDHVMQQLKEKPFLRTHYVSSWIPQYTLTHEGLTRNVVVAPCHGNIHILANRDTQELSIHHVQRSGDLPVGVPFNMVQYAAFGLMAAAHVGYTLKEVVYTISDAHIYGEQYDDVEELISREPRRLGSLTLARVVPNIKDYRPNDFLLSDYDPHPKKRISTPV